MISAFGTPSLLQNGRSDEISDLELARCFWTAAYERDESSVRRISHNVGQRRPPWYILDTRFQSKA